MSQSDLAMVHHARQLLITNTGGLRGKAIKGAFKVYISFLFRTQVLGHDPERARHGHRLEDGWSNSEVAEYLLSTSKQAFTGANVLEGAAPHESTLQ